MKKRLVIIIALVFVFCYATALAGRAGSSSSYGSSNSRVGSSNSYAYKPIYVHVNTGFSLKEYPSNSSRTIYPYNIDDDLQAYAKYFDSRNGIYWIKVECPPGSGQLGWAGKHHFDITNDELSDLPYADY